MKWNLGVSSFESRNNVAPAMSSIVRWLVFHSMIS